MIVNQGQEVEIVSQDPEVEIADRDHVVEIVSQDPEVEIADRDHVVEIVAQGLIVGIVIERAREVVVHEAGVEVEKGLKTNGESIDHEVEIDPEDLVVKTATGREAGAKKEDHEAEKDLDQRMTAKRLWKLRLREKGKVLAMRRDK